MSSLIVENLSRTYGNFSALKDVSFEIGHGKFVTLLGPSGCGKSTTLWSLAGLDTPTGGTITFQGRTVVDVDRGIFVPPEKRDFGLVFQSYAVWPHMTVRKNLEYPLKIRKASRQEINSRVEEIASLVEMTEHLDKYPYQLSGGQQQRVALARTLVYGPKLLLLDEPLSNLDAKLRVRARSWLKTLHKQLGLTTIYVTHDQDEALAMSDEILVLDKGVVVQRGLPEEVYLSPKTPFVADFIGNSNLLRGKVVAVDANSATVDLGAGATIQTAPSEVSVGESVVVAVRQEAVSFTPPVDQAEYTTLVANIVNVSYLGAVSEVEMTVGDNAITALVAKRSGPSSTVQIYIGREDCRILSSAK